MAVDIAQLLAFAVKNNASDLHLSSGVPPMIRVDGDMKRINMPPLSHKEVAFASTPSTRTAARGRCSATSPPPSSRSMI
jgi:Tfp pilus assembly pilus retraction ATPase PilT